LGAGECWEGLTGVEVESDYVLDGVLREKRRLVNVKPLLFAPSLHANVQVVSVQRQLLYLLENVPNGGYVRWSEHSTVAFAKEVRN
jgi:hypothetical protein